VYICWYLLALIPIILRIRALMTREHWTGSSNGFKKTFWNRTRGWTQKGEKYKQTFYYLDDVDTHFGMSPRDIKITYIHS
jgi:hypothetical protein